MTEERTRLSAVLNIHNEEAVLRDCLSQLRFCDEIVVILDKCTDGSEAIAREMSDRVLSGDFELEGERRNLGIDTATGDWILEIDADEIVTDALRDEIRATVQTADADIYNVPIHNYVGGRLVLHGWGGKFGANGRPTLFRKGVKRWGMERVHPDLLVNGRQGPDLTNPIIHHVDRNLSDMIRRFDSYTSKRALDLIDGNEIGSFPNMVRKIFSRFWKSYVARKGYREGGYGIAISLFAALYPVVSHLKAREILDDRNGQSAVTGSTTTPTSGS
jgi:glycosyltransferase involved in cell wall biosynthesis